MKVFAAGIVVIVILIGGLLFLTRSQTKQDLTQTPPVTSPVPTSDEKVDIKASFKITTDRAVRIFTDPKYHNQSEDVYIQLPDPGIIHVTKKGITWDDFFKTLPMKLTKDCLTTGTGQVFCNGDEGTLKFYLNDVEDKNLLDKEIKDGDKILIEFKQTGIIN